MTTEKDVKQLSDMLEEINVLTKKYNKLAKKLKFHGRVAYMTADYEDYEDYEDCEFEADGADISINAPDADEWFPSSIC